MQKCLALLCCLMLGLPLQAAAEEKPAFHVVASFYPVYLLTAQVVEGVDGVTLTSMTQPQGGHLHDYQLTPQDLRALSDASAFVINGAGMEGFLSKVIDQYGDLPVIDASAGIPLRYGADGHVHAEEDAGHAHDGEVPNGHVWLDPRLAARQVRNIAEGLGAADPARGDAYRANGEAYAAKLEAAYEDWLAQLAPLPHRQLVTFHDAFPYFAAAFDLEALASVHFSQDSPPSTRELADLIDLVQAQGVTALFAEPGYDVKTVQIVAGETGAQVYVLDPMESGEFALDAYETTMQRNIDTLVEALSR